MNTMRLIPLTAFTLFAACLTGCGTHVSIPAWQRSMEHYIDHEANCDPSVLQDLDAGRNHDGFSLISKNYTYDSNDAHGVLVGHPTVEGETWFVYLVGMVDHEHIDDIRIAAMTMRDGKFVWETSDRSRDATNAYRNWNTARGRTRFPGRKKLPPEYRGYPRDTDSFRLTTNADRSIEIYHDESTAHWSLTLPIKNEN